MATSRIYVPDASVILKWVFPSPAEQDRDQALDLLNLWLTGVCEFVLPSLWIYEVGNVLGQKNPSYADQVMETLLGYRFREAVMDKALAGTALQIMRDRDVTFYDAVYHAVAILNQGIFITADAAYLRKTKDMGHIASLLEQTFE